MPATLPTGSWWGPSRSIYNHRACWHACAGDSWPTVDPCPSPDPAADAGFQQGFGPGPVAPEFEGFRFSADMWTEQVRILPACHLIPAPAGDILPMSQATTGCWVCAAAVFGNAHTGAGACVVLPSSQLTYFLEQFVGRPAILCGNSLGGFISVNLTSQRPDLAAGLVLLNATPFWGTTALSFWDGTYPLPQALR